MRFRFLMPIVMLVLLFGAAMLIGSDQEFVLTPAEDPNPGNEMAPMDSPDGLCVMYYTDWTAGWYLTDTRAGYGYYTYYDITTLCTPDNYPFEITEVDFWLYDFLYNPEVWPLEIDIVVRDAADGPPDGTKPPGAEICRYSFATWQGPTGEGQESYQFPTGCCVYDNFFVGIEFRSSSWGYYSDTDTLPSLRWDNNDIPPGYCWLKPPSGNWWDFHEVWPDPATRLGWHKMIVIGEPESDCGGITCPWNEGDSAKMHYPQPPDIHGMDVGFSYHHEDTVLDIRLADDWECTESGWVKDIHFWGSWKYAIERYLKGFYLEIYSDIPEDSSGLGYSIPGDLLWDRYVTDIEAIHFFPNEWQSWFDVFDPQENFPENASDYYQYNICLDEEDWFLQDSGTIYWLCIKADANISPGEDYSWAWKTTDPSSRFNDAAVIGMYGPISQELIWIAMPFDFSFVITGGDDGGETPEEELEACCLPDGCRMLTPSNCIANYGFPMGAGSECDHFQIIACCLPDGSCEMMSDICCVMFGGTPLPSGTCLGDGNSDGIDDACDHPSPPPERVHVDVTLSGESSPAESLYAESAHDFRFWIENASTVGGMSLGFKVWGDTGASGPPSGASWSWADGKTYGGMTGPKFVSLVEYSRIDPDGDGTTNNTFDGGFLVTSQDIDENSPDTFMLGGFVYDSAGIAAGTLEPMIKATFTPHIIGNTYRIICIDSSFVPPSGAFLFVDAGGGTTNPYIFGPYCWPVVEPNDSDQDGIIDMADGCPNDYDPGQEDQDSDGVGDACDNCPEDPNPDQLDSNGNGMGDACEWKCGDANGDNSVNVADAVFLIAYVFRNSGIPPDPLCLGFANHDEGVQVVNTGDIVYLIAYIFRGGPPPVEGCCVGQ